MTTHPTTPESRSKALTHTGTHKGDETPALALPGVPGARLAVLTLPWLLAEPEPVPIPADLEPVPVSVAAETLPARPVAFLVTLGLTAAWCIAVALLTMTGAMFPIEGNFAFYLVAMAGIFCGTFLTLAWPREAEEKPEQFWTWGSEPSTAAQCTPSRVTYTGRVQS